MKDPFLLPTVISIYKFTDECKRLGETVADFKRISANYELLQKDKERLDIKYSAIERENKELTDRLNQTMEQLDSVKSDFDILSERMKSLQAEKESTDAILKGNVHTILCEEDRKNQSSTILLGKSMQLEENEMELMRITTKYEWLMKETERVDSELISLNRKNEDLNESIEHRDAKQSEMDEKLRAIQIEKDELSNALEGILFL